MAAPTVSPLARKLRLRPGVRAARDRYGVRVMGGTRTIEIVQR